MEARTIQITREAVCLADDQMEPLELTLKFGAEATLADLTDKLARSGVLHFSATCRVLVDQSANTPLLKRRRRWGSLASPSKRSSITR